MSGQTHRTEHAEWWNVEWFPNRTTCGYGSLELAREAMKTAVSDCARIVRVTQVTHTITEEVRP